MEYIINYITDHSSSNLLLRKTARTKPQYGDIVFIKGSYYRNKDIKYNLEVRQSIGIKVFDVVVDHIQETLYDFKFNVINNKYISLFGINGKCPKEVFIPSHINVNGNILPITFVSWITFTDAEACEVLYLPDTIENFEILDDDNIKEVFLGNAYRLKDFSFTNCKNLLRVTLPPCVEKIPPLAFAGCEKLHDIIIENEKLKFHPSTFTMCKSLNKDLPFIKENYVIENGLLLNKHKDEVYTYLSNNKNEAVKDYHQIILPHTVRYIGSGFSNSDINSIDLSNTSITEIENDTFSDCYNLNNIILPNNLKRIGDRAFSSCINLQEIIFPASLEELGIACFSGTGMKDIEFRCLPENILQYAFEDCNKLERVSIPHSVKSINLTAFKGCSTIRYVNIPYGFKSIANKLFKNYNYIQFVFATKYTVPFELTNANIYTHGSLACPYCSSKNVRTFCDGTAICQTCYSKFTYWKL